MCHAMQRVCACVFLATLSGVVSAQGTTRTFQATPGAAPAHTTRSVIIRSTGSVLASANWVTENDRLEARSNTGVPLVDFPHIFGTGTDQIPPGSIITSASLELWCTQIDGSPTLVRNITCKTITDFDRYGTWHEPETPGSQQLYAGVNWFRRDGRPGSDRPWDATLGPITVADDPALVSAYPSLVQTVPVSTQGTNTTQTWHAFDVTGTLQFWSQGLSNQGFRLENDQFFSVWYASDDEPNTSLRPRLRVSWVPGPPPANNIPRLLPPFPSASVTTPAGTQVSFILDAIDDDGTPVTFRITSPPQHGTIVGQFPYYSYRPDAEFVGQDSFSYTAYDALSVAYPQTVTVTTTATAGQSVLKLQEGVSGGSAAESRCAATFPSIYPTGQFTYRLDFMPLVADSRISFLDFPNLIGSAANQIPPGSTVVSAQLRLRIRSIGAQGSDTKHVAVRRILDPLNRGSSWFEPAGIVNGCTSCGVSWLHPDARIIPPATSPASAWHIPGGDAHPSEGSTIDIGPSDVAGDWKTVDVTQAVQAWAAGAPNLGWQLTNSSSNWVYFETDQAGVGSNPGQATDRPILVIAYRPPAAGALTVAVPPHALAGPDQLVYSAQRVNLDATASWHPNGTPFSHLWFQIGGSPVTLSGLGSPTPSFTAPTVTGPQRLIFRYAAFDGVRFSIDDVAVEVRPQPGGGSIASPVVDAGPAVSVPELTPVTFNASVSGGTGSHALLWTQISGPHVPLANPTTATPSLTTPSVAPGATTVLVFDLAVTDTGVPSGMTSVVHDTVTVTVANAPNSPPIPVTPGVLQVERGQWITLDATASSDPEGQSLTFSWTQNLGPAVNLSAYVPQGTAEAAVVPLRIPPAGGAGTLQFTVTVDDGELTATANVTVNIAAPLPEFSGSLTMTPYRDALTNREARHLLRRLGAGWHPDDVAQMRANGLAATVLAALAELPSSAVDDEAVNYAPNLVTTLNVPAPLNQPFDPYPQFSPPQIHSHWLVHTFRSPQTLKERLVRFFHDRFAANARTVGLGKRQWSLMYADTLRDGFAFGTGALGNYRGFLRDMVRDPLILSFINGFDNLAFSPNENYAREFMELHTLGVFDYANGARLYSEQDVKEAARAFTGFRPACFPVIGGSCYPSFVPWFHDYGVKNLFLNGSGVPEFSGAFGDFDMVDNILAKRGGLDASRWLALGLIGTFVMDEPPPALVDQVATVIRNRNWEIGQVLSELLMSEAMFSPMARKSIVKTPTDFMLGLTKTLRIPLQTWDLVGVSSPGNQSLLYYITSLEQSLGLPVDVDGWPKGRLWLSGYTMVRRAEAARVFIRLGRNPTQPGFTNGLPYPNFPGIAPTPIDMTPFMPPTNARFSTETLEHLLETLDVDFNKVPGTLVSGGTAATSEFDLARQFLDTFANNGSTLLFDGDDPSFENKFFELLLLCLQHPDFQRL